MKSSICSLISKPSFLWYWSNSICYKSSICSPISKLFWYIGRISILLKKFNFFTQIRASNFQIFICYKSSICSPVSKLAILKYWSNFYFVKKVHFVYPYSNFYFVQRVQFVHPYSNFYFVKRVQFVHPYWIIQFPIIFVTKVQFVHQ